ncbi:MAG: hypothetical protein AB7V46_02490 [Thermomicrobiales bacterium]
MVLVATGQNAKDPAKGVSVVAGHAAAALNTGIDLAGICGALANDATAPAIVDVVVKVSTDAATALRSRAGAFGFVQTLLPGVQLTYAADAVGVVTAIATNGACLSNWATTVGFPLSRRAVGFEAADCGGILAACRSEWIADGLQCKAVWLASITNARLTRRTSAAAGQIRGARLTVVALIPFAMTVARFADAALGARAEHSVICWLAGEGGQVAGDAVRIKAGFHTVVNSAALVFSDTDGSSGGVLTAAGSVP